MNSRSLTLTSNLDLVSLGGSSKDRRRWNELEGGSKRNVAQQHIDQRQDAEQRARDAAKEVILQIGTINNDLLKERTHKRSLQMSLDHKKATHSEDSDKPKEPFMFAGYLGAILASMSFAMSLLLVKLLSVEENIRETSKTSMFRGATMMLLCGISIIHRGHSFKIEKGEYLVNSLRVFFGSSNVFLSFVSLIYISIGESQTIVKTSCIWTCLIAFFLLNEALPLILILAIPLNFLGIILMMLPDMVLSAINKLTGCDQLKSVLDSTLTIGEPQLNATMTTTTTTMIGGTLVEHRWLGFLAAILASLSFSGSTICLKMPKKTSIPTCTFYHGIGQVVLGLCVQLVIGFGTMPTSALEWTLQFLVGFFAFLAQSLFQWSLKFVHAGTYSVMRTLEIPFSFLLHIIFLDDPIHWHSVVGSALIVIVIIMLVFNNKLASCFESIRCGGSRRNLH